MRIDSLTSLRFFAAFAVFLHHLQYLTFTSGPSAPLLYHWFHDGDAGVKFFFILSGFIISHAYNKRIELPGGHADFLFGRFSRLYPTHLLTLLAAVLIGGVTAEQFLANLTLTQSFSANMVTAFSGNAVAWSISDEMFFYAMFALIAGIATRHLLALLILVASVSVYFALYGDITSEFQYSMLYSNPVLQFGNFLIGMLLYRAFSERRTLSFWNATALEICAVLGLVVFYLYSVLAGVPETWRIGLYYAPPMAAVILIFAYNSGALSKALAWRPLVYLGKVSFAFYMVHHLVIAVIMRHTATTYTTLPIGLGYGLLMFCIALPVAAIVHSGEVFVDKWLKAKRGAYKARTPQVVISPAASIV